MVPPSGSETEKKLFCLIKLRPGAIDFIRSARKLFKIFICTLGSFEYATEIRNRLNQLVGESEGKESVEAIEPIIFSREHHLSENSRYKKSFEKILTKSHDLPLLDSVSLIVDDRADIWVDKYARSNLIPISPYSYFFQQPIYELEAAQHGLTNKVAIARTPTLNIDTDDHKDKSLRQIWAILIKIHQAYFKSLGNEIDFYKLPHIEMFLKPIRESVLENITIYPIGQKLDTILYMAELFGAKVVKEKSKEITHVIVQKNETIPEEERNYFGCRPIYVVKKEWLYYSIRHWVRLREREYLLCT